MDSISSQSNKGLLDQITQFSKKALFKIQSISSWSFPAKIALAGVVSALGGSSLIGFLSEYATYLYCISYGVRPPIEGIPYLKATVTAGSIFLLLSGALIFILVTSIFGQALLFLFLIEKYMARISIPFLKTANKDFPTRKIREMSRNEFIIVSIIATALLVIITLALFKYLPEIKILDPKTNQEILKLTREQQIYTSLALIASAWIPMLILWKPSGLWWLAAVSSLANMLFWIVILFVPSYHANLLRYIGYGGGIPINIELKDKSSQQLIDPTYLIVRTNTALITLDKKSNQIIEIPLDQIAKMRHDAGGLLNLKSTLPTIIRAKPKLETP